MSDKLYRLDLRVAGKWVPATAEPMPESRAERLKQAYAVDRPHIQTRVVPVNGNGAGKRKRGRR